MIKEIIFTKFISKDAKRNIENKYRVYKLIFFKLYKIKSLLLIQRYIENIKFIFGFKNVKSIHFIIILLSRNCFVIMKKRKHIKKTKFKALLYKNKDLNGGLIIIIPHVIQCIYKFNQNSLKIRNFTFNNLDVY